MLAFFLGSRREARSNASRALLYNATLMGQSIEGKLRAARVVLDSSAGRSVGELKSGGLLDLANLLPDADNVYLLGTDGEVAASAYPRREPRLVLNGRVRARLGDAGSYSVTIAAAPAEGGVALASLRLREGEGEESSAIAVILATSLLEGRLRGLASTAVSSIAVEDADGGRALLFGSESGRTMEASYELASFPLKVVARADEGRALAEAWRQGKLFLLIFAACSLLCIGLVAYGSRLNARARRAAELDRELAAKDALFNEVNHRVKNNLAIVASILGLGEQGLEDGDKSPAAVFESAIDRVRSIAILHEQLYKSSSLATTDFGAYTSALVGSLQDSYGQGGRVEVSVIAEPELAVGLNEAVPLGLILTELVTNAYKYAFPAGRGRLRIEARAGPGKALELRVEDDGVGIGGGGEAKKGFGLSLVQSLAEQIGAKAECEPAEPRGTRWVVSLAGLGGAGQAQ